MTDHLYFIRTIPSGHIKIGRSHQPEKRIQELQVGNVERLVLELVVPGQGYLEDTLLAKHHAAKLHGEWHRCSEQLRLSMSILRCWVDAFESWMPSPSRARRRSAAPAQLQLTAVPPKRALVHEDAVLRAVELHKLGKSYWGIAKALNAEGFPTRTGTGSWHSMQVRRVIHRERVQGASQ